MDMTIWHFKQDMSFGNRSLKHLYMSSYSDFEISKFDHILHRPFDIQPNFTDPFFRFCRIIFLIYMANTRSSLDSSVKSVWLRFISFKFPKSTPWGFRIVRFRTLHDNINDIFFHLFNFSDNLNVFYCHCNNLYEFDT